MVHGEQKHLASSLNIFRTRLSLYGTKQLGNWHFIQVLTEPFIFFPHALASVWASIVIAVIIMMMNWHGGCVRNFLFDLPILETQNIGVGINPFPRPSMCSRFQVLANDFKRGLAHIPVRRVLFAKNAKPLAVVAKGRRWDIIVAVATIAVGHHSCNKLQFFA